MDNLDKITWNPGNHGKGIVDEDGAVHAWNEDDYELHRDYLAEHPDISPMSYFYIEPTGAIDITHPSKHYGDHEAHDLMQQHIGDADPHFHPNPDQDSDYFSF
jgi:hypothetical protein